MNILEMSNKVNIIVNFYGSQAFEEMLNECGEIYARGVKQASKELIYDTPPSPSYARTGYLHASIYYQTATEDGYPTAHAQASRIAANAQRGLQRRGRKAFSNLAQQYEMEHADPPGPNTVKVVAGALYATDVEYGNNPRGPRPFMRVGFERVNPHVNKYMADYVRNYMSQAARSAPRNALGRFVRRFTGR